MKSILLALNSMYIRSSWPESSSSKPLYRYRTSPLIPLPRILFKEKTAIISKKLGGAKLMSSLTIPQGESVFLSRRSTADAFAPLTGTLRSEQLLRKYNSLLSFYGAAIRTVILVTPALLMAFIALLYAARSGTSITPLYPGFCFNAS